ncbi:MAG TPA: hypothetical protein PLT92_13780 [Ignavibacteriaceae bacterium]|nr:hypothetical protein [Ignavibacteriaceae bacterium]
MKKYLLFIAFSCTILLSFQDILSQTVYITKSGKKFHKAECSYLKSSIAIELNDALNRGYEPCSKCKPPTKVKQDVEGMKSNSNEKTIEKKTSKSEVTSAWCQAITKKGTQCKRKAKPGSKYCWQHGG